jgi:hypothetical protein
VYIGHGKHLLYLVAVIDVEEDTYLSFRQIWHAKYPPFPICLAIARLALKQGCILLEFDSELEASHIL